MFGNELSDVLAVSTQYDRQTDGRVVVTNWACKQC